METGKTLKVIAVLLLILALVIFAWGIKDWAKDWVSEKLNVSLGDWGNFLTLPNFSFSNNNLSGGSGGGTGTEGGDNQVKEYRNLPDDISPEEVSYFYEKVRISASAISDNSSYLKNPSKIRLSFSLKEGEAANITNWKIQGNRDALFVGQAVKYLDPRNEHQKKDVVVSGSERVNIYSSISAMGKSFMTNKCIGYITRTKDFIPGISGGCYSIPRRDYDFMSGSCQNLINSYNGRCTNPFNGSLSNYTAEDCRQVLKRFSYQSCYEEHYKDDDFLTGEWHLWAGQNILDSQHDKIRLYDRDGKFVAEYKY